MAATQSVTELLSNAAPLHPGDADYLAEWAKCVEDSNTKLKAGCDLGMATTGETIPVDEFVGEHADIEVGTFNDGWIAIPAFSSECPNCEGEQPALTVGNVERDIILIDCLNCRTRYDVMDVADDGGDV